MSTSSTATGQRFTVVGFWDDAEVVSAGYIPGDHTVRGGDKLTDMAPFSEVFTVNVDDPTDEETVTAALHAAIAAAYYDTEEVDQ